MMKAKPLQQLHRDLVAFLQEFTPWMGRADRQQWAQTYVRGLLLDGKRKSIEPMAQRLKRIDRSDKDYEQALQQFVNQSPWDAQAVRQALARHVHEHARPQGFLIVDDTGFPKQGRHSVGVARQYSGTLGKVGNCQVAVTLAYAEGHSVYPLDAELYLPQHWAADRPRRQQAGVPEDVEYQPKWQLALQLLRRAQAQGLAGTVLADSLFGSVTDFRQALDDSRWSYCVGVDSTLVVIDAQTDLGAVPDYGGRGRRPSRPEQVRARMPATSVKQWALEHATDFRQVTWRKGTRGKLKGRFAAWRVRPAHRLSAGQEPLAPCWLLVEWPPGEDAPTKFFFSNLPEQASRKQLVQTAKSRWWIEHSYQQMKDELGLDHFEGRGWTGWYHHVTLVMLAYAFLVHLRKQRKKKRGARR